MRALRISILAVIAIVRTASLGFAADEPVGIALEGIPYPHPVAFFPVTLEGQELRLAYMDVGPAAPANGRTVLLLHGRNFPASYWESTIAPLAQAGYRVVVPDQLGFGKSSKPTFDYHFDTLAATTAALLDRLAIVKFDIVGHSMGGMLAVRLTRTHPQRVDRMILEAPIGLEDYRFYVPPVATERLLEQERDLSAEAYRNQLTTNYSLKPELIETFVAIREGLKQSGEYPRWLRSFVNSYQMIYREPVVHEIPLIAQQTLFVMGGRDHNAPGRSFAPAEWREKMGRNVELATALAARMPAARVEVLEGIGHVPHLEATQWFNAALLGFLGGAR